MRNVLNLKTLLLLTAFGTAASVQAGEPVHPAGTSLEPAMNGAVSASGRFPTQAMEDEFNAYLRWVDGQGLDRQHALQPAVAGERSLEPAINGEVSASGRFPTQAMEDEFQAYRTWTGARGLGTGYAFNQ